MLKSYGIISRNWWKIWTFKSVIQLPLQLPMTRDRVVHCYHRYWHERHKFFKQPSTISVAKNESRETRFLQIFFIIRTSHDTTIALHCSLFERWWKIWKINGEWILWKDFCSFSRFIRGRDWSLCLSNHWNYSISSLDNTKCETLWTVGDRCSKWDWCDEIRSSASNDRDASSIRYCQRWNQWPFKRTSMNSSDSWTDENFVSYHSSVALIM